MHYIGISRYLETVHRESSYGPVEQIQTEVKATQKLCLMCVVFVDFVGHVKEV